MEIITFKPYTLLYIIGDCKDRKILRILQTPEEIFELGKDTALAASNASANGLGLVFSAVLEFILTHPTATVLGISGIIYGLAKAFKFMVRKLGEHEVKKHEKNMSKVR